MKVCLFWLYLFGCANEACASGRQIVREESKLMNEVEWSEFDEMNLRWLRYENKCRW